MMHYLCPACEGRLRADDPDAGKPFQCPHCGRRGVVPPVANTVDYDPAVAGTLAGPPPAGPDDEAPAVLLDEAGPAVPPPPPAPAGYEIEELLGRGGMGVVYRARQVKLNRRVALKMIRDGALADSQDLARFQTEAEAVAQLQHPNIVQIYEVGDHEGRPYFSLEYVPGGNLDKLLAGKPLLPPEAAGLLETLARAVHHAHLHGIIHRDLKPANILLAFSREPRASAGALARGSRLNEGVPKITDFGLAKRLNAAPGSPGSGKHTQTGAILGTPSYMAPEQAGGKEAIGPAADVYALGAILYEAVTGRPPFLAANPLDTLMQVVAEEPVPPTRLQPKLPRDLETICLKCLQKDPRKRYASALELADDLRRFQNDEPILARPVGRWERVRRWCHRNPVVASLLAALVVVFTAGMAGIVWNWRAATAAQAEAEDKARLAAAAERKERQSAREARREKVLAQRLAGFALEQEARAEERLYFNRVALANRYWLAGNVERAEELLDVCPPKRRGWEWHYLKRLCRAELLTLTGHHSAVSAVAVSPDGRRIASASLDDPGPYGAVLTVWDAATGNALYSIPAHEERITSLAFSPHGRRLASADSGGVIKLWDARTGRPVRLPPIQHGPPIKRWGAIFAGAKSISTITGALGVTFSPDGTKLATSGADHLVRLWDARTGKQLRTYTGHSRPCNDVAFSPHGRRLATASDDGSVKVWDVATGKPKATLTGHSGPVTSVAFHPDGKLLASAGQDRTIKVWSAVGGKEVRTLRGHAAAVYRVRWSPDGNLASAGADKTVRVWDTVTGLELFTLRGHAGAVRGLAYDRTGHRLISAGDDKTVKVWDARTGGQARVLAGSACVAFSPDSRRLATAFSNGQAEVWDLRTGESAFSSPVRVEPLRSLAFHPDGRRLALAGGVIIAVMDTRKGGGKKGRPVSTNWTSKRGWVEQLAFSPDGSRLALAMGDPGGTVKVLAARNGRKIANLRRHSGGAVCVAFSPDGRLLASAGRDDAIKLWDTATWKELRTLRGHAGPVRAVAFSSRGRLLASAGDDETVKVWEVRTGKERLTLKGHTGPVRAVAFGRAGRLASASQDTSNPPVGEVKFWDTRTGQELLTLEHPAAALAFSPDGRRLALAGAGGLVRVWDGIPLRERLTFRDAGAGVAFSPDGRFLVAPGNYETVQVWDTRSLARVRSLRGHQEVVRRTAFSPDGKRFASASEDNTVKVWGLRTGKALRTTFRGHRDWVNAVAFGPKGKRVVSGSYDRTAQIWEANTGKAICTFAGHADRVLGVAFHPAGKWAASGGDDRTVAVWDARTGRRRWQRTGHGDSVNAVAFSPDGRYLASASDDQTIIIWRVRTGKKVRTLRGHTAGVRDVAFRPDGKRLASAGWDSTVRVWDARTGKLVDTLRGHQRGVRAVSFCARDGRLASAGDDMTLRIWELK
jgi:WD40 repeat protein/serine/threonine protein kinase